jgi:hypothetical protein
MLAESRADVISGVRENKRQLDTEINLPHPTLKTLIKYVFDPEETDSI